MIGLLLLIAAGVALASSGTSSPLQGVVAMPGYGPEPEPQRVPTDAPVPPPGQSEHPEQPDNPDAGRFYETRGVVLNDGAEYTREMDVLELATNAGTFTISASVTEALIAISQDMPERDWMRDACITTHYELDIVDGVLVDARVVGQSQERCRADAENLQARIGTFAAPFEREQYWQQQDRTLALVQTIVGRLEIDEVDYAPFSPGDSFADTLATEVLWEVSSYQ